MDYPYRTSTGVTTSSVPTTVGNSRVALKQEADVSLSCDFYLSEAKTDPDCDMDLASLLGEKSLFDQPGPNENRELHSLFSGELEEFNFLDPTTGIAKPPLDTTSVLPPHVGGGGDGSGGWLLEQTQKLERQQHLQQQKLFELQQTLLQTEILKNQIQIASNLKGSGGSSNRSSPTSSLLNQVLTRSPDSTGVLTPNGQPKPTQHYGFSAGVSSIGTGGTTDSSGSNSSMMCDIGAEEQLDYSCDQFEPEGKKKSHNLIEKKYRTSINDRIGMLRSIVSKHFKDDKKMQKSAVLQKTIDYIRYLQNANRKLAEENQRLRSVVKGGQAHQSQLDSVGSNPSPSFLHHNSHQTSPLSMCESTDEGHPSSPDVFLSDHSGSNSPLSNSQLPQLFSSALLHSTLSRPSHHARVAGRTFFCFMMVVCFLVDPFSSSSSVMASVHGSQRTLNWFGVEGPELTTTWWDMAAVMCMWSARVMVAAVCFGVVWAWSLPGTNEQDRVKYWRLRKQAEQDIKKGELANAESRLLEALGEVGITLPSSYIMLLVHLAWHAVCHALFQIGFGRLAVNVVKMLRGWSERVPLVGMTKRDSGLRHGHVAQTLHLVHQISLASYDGRTMHGAGFLLGLKALNYGEVDRPMLSQQQWAELLFTMGIQFQFSCACVAPTLARYYFLCAGSVGGTLSWTKESNGWEYLLSKEWVRDVQTASRMHPGIAAFPKFSVTRSYLKSQLTAQFKELLLPPHGEQADVQDCLETFTRVLQYSRQANNYLINDLNILTAQVPTLSDVLATKESGFEVLTWWAAVGCVACCWRRGDEKEAEKQYTVIEDITEESGPVATALLLVFKAQRLHHSPNLLPHPQVIVQLCATAGDSLNTCQQSMGNEDELNLLGLLLACDWLLSLRYSLWEEHKLEPSTARQLVAGYSQETDVLSRLVALLPSAFPRLNLYKSYHSLMSGGNPLLTQALLSSSGHAPSTHHQVHRPVYTAS